MPYLVPISICALLQLIVLFLFIFLAEETLSQTELANKRKQKAEKDVTPFNAADSLERTQSSFTSRFECFHRLARLSQVNRTTQLLVCLLKPFSYPLCCDLWSVSIRSDVL